ncbi:MAG: prepilin-type N-terminal cleavage/methylation domain-containing protein [Proteobacteria bacterium]|nr:prepilin-type N-terminal cleavage/methylation domain-containing protein [Pseudomonadota bacterium]
MMRRPRGWEEKGFTLLEIMLAVGIGVVFMGGAAVFLSSTGGDRDLAKARAQLEEAAGKARESALGTGKARRERRWPCRAQPTCRRLLRQSRCWW